MGSQRKFGRTQDAGRGRRAVQGDACSRNKIRPSIRQENALGSNQGGSSSPAISSCGRRCREVRLERPLSGRRRVQRRGRAQARPGRSRSVDGETRPLPIVDTRPTGVDAARGEVVGESLETGGQSRSRGGESESRTTVADGGSSSGSGMQRRTRKAPRSTAQTLALALRN